MSLLYKSTHLKGHLVRNRVVFPPMVCFNWSDNYGIVSKLHLEHYEKRSVGGVGMVIVEATAINPLGRLAPSQLGIWNEQQVDGLSRLADVINSNGAISLLQIHHAGDKTPKSVTEEPVAPSSYILSDGRKTKSLTKGEIKMIQLDFLEAALRAEKAGFHGIEIHGAHGYLINQFLSPTLNQRKDEYGGTFENRLRFIKEVMEMLTDHLPENFILGYRHGANTPDLDGGMEIAKALEKMGVDLLHVSAGIGEADAHPTVPAEFPYNWIVYMGSEVQKTVDIPVILVNGIRTPPEAEELINNNDGDFVAIGRGILVDSKWSVKGAESKTVNPCHRCRPRCYYIVDGRKCPQYTNA